MKWEMEVEEKEIEAVLEKILDLHDKFSDAILSISRAHFLSSVKSRGRANHFCFPDRCRKKVETDSDQNAQRNTAGFVYVKEFRAGDDDDDGSAAVHEAKSLNAIRTALENLEDQLQFFHSSLTHQRAERDVALARLEQSQILLSMRLAEYQGKKYKFIEEAEALVGDFRDGTHLISPENLFVNKPRLPQENFAEGKRSNMLFNVVLSSFKFVKRSLKQDHVGGMLGNAAMVAISMFALIHLQQAGCKEKCFLDLPPTHNNAFHNRNLTKVSPPASSSSTRLSDLDVLSARG